MKRSTLLLSILLFFAARPAARADDLQPILVAGVSSYERFLADVQFVGEQIKDIRYTDRISALVDILLQTKGTKIDKIEGLDTKKPLGAAVVTDGVAIIPLIMFPITGELTPLLESLKPLVGDTKADADGVFAYSQGNRSGYAKSQNGWAFFAQTRDQLANLPNPDKLFADLPSEHDVAMRLYITNIPEVFRNLAVDQLRISVETAAVQKQDESEAIFAFRRDLGKLQSQLLERVIGESEQITAVGSLDREKSHGSFELRVKPIDDSPLAAHLSELRNSTTRYGGLLTISDEEKGDVSLAMNMTGPLDKQLLDEYAALVKAYRDYTLELIEKSSDVKSTEERATLKELAEGITDVLRTTIEAGKLDAVIRMVEPTKAKGNSKAKGKSLILAVHVAKGDELKKLVDRIAELSQGDPGFTNVKLNAVEIDGTPVHTLIFKPKADSPAGQVAKLFDDQLALHVAVQEDNFFLAVGNQGPELIKRGLELQEAPVPPMQGRLRLLPLMRLATQSIQQNEIRTAGSLLMSTVGALDAIQLKAEVDPEGQLRLAGDTEIGPVKLIGTIVGPFGPMVLELMGNQGGGGNPAAGLFGGARKEAAPKPNPPQAEPPKTEPQESEKEAAKAEPPK